MMKSEKKILIQSSFIHIRISFFAFVISALTFFAFPQRVTPMWWVRVVDVTICSPGGTKYSPRFSVFSINMSA